MRRRSEPIHTEPDPVPDPALDRYRFGLAQVLRDGVQIGYLSTTVTVIREERGRGRPRRLINPQEIVVWLLQADDGSGLFADGADHSEDGWDVDGKVLREIACDEFRWSDKVLFALKWVDPAKEPAEWRAHYESEWAAAYRSTGIKDPDADGRIRAVDGEVPWPP